MKVPTFLSALSLCRKCTDEVEEDKASRPANIGSASPVIGRKSFGAQIHPQPGNLDSPDEMKPSPTEPEGILRSGITCIHVEHAPPLRHESELVAAVRFDRNSLDLDASHELISQRSLELTRNHSKAPLRSSSAPIAVQDGRSSSSNQPEISSGNQSAVSSSTRSEARDITAQTEPIEDSILQQSTNRQMEAFVDSSVGPPPPDCSQCNSDQHSGSCNLLRRFSAKEILEVTDGYSADNWFGYQHDLLYKGKLDNRRVYVVRKESDDSLNFFSEIDILRSIRHPNILTLRGYCDEDNHLALVFDFVCNRCLSFHLDAKNLQTMQWQHRANLARQIAKGLVYLHDNNIIHGNVNSKYVFVHRDFTPLIAQFRLARSVADGRDVNLQDRSKDLKSRGYLAPEYAPGGTLSMQLDVYAFGVILFELITGRPAFYRREFLGEWGRATVEGSLPEDQGNLVKTMADPRLFKGSSFDMCDMLRMIKVAALCTKKDPTERPLMAEVLHLLTDDLMIQQSQAIPEQEVVDEYDDDTPYVLQTGNEVEVQEMLTGETEIERRETLERPAAPSRQVRWVDKDPDAMETEKSSSLPSPDNDQTFKKSLPLSEMAVKFLREMRAACESNRYFQRSAQDHPGECSSNKYNYYQRRGTRPRMRPPPSPARNFRRPSTPGHRLRNSRTHSGSMSPVQVNVVIRYYKRRSERKRMLTCE